MEWIELGELVEQVRGVTYKKNDAIAEEKANYVPIIRANNIQEFKFDYSDLLYLDPNKIREDQYITDGDIIIASSSGSKKIVGKAVQAKKNMKFSFGAFCKIIRTTNNKINNRYVGYYFNSDDYRNKISNLAEGANINNIRNEHIDNLKIPVPPMETQENIVKVLDHTQALIDERKEQIEALDQLIGSIFYTMFGDPVRNEKGWEVKELEKVAPIKNHNIDEEIESVWLLNLDMIESNSGVLKEKIYVEIEDLPSSINCFSNKHILYSKLRPYLNKVFMPDDNGYCTSELVPLLPDCKVLNREYLLYLLRGRPALHYFNTHTSGARMPRVVMKDLKKMKISVPPLSLQNKFANKVETIEKQKEVLGESLELMEENYKSIMDKAFKGQLFN